GGSVAVSADGSTFVWSPSTSQGVICYVNGGWKAVSTLPAGANICSDRVNPKVFYAYAKNTFFVSSDGGQTFTAVKTDLLPAASKIKAVPGKEGHVWIPGSSEGLFYTTDGGKTITKAAGFTKCDVVGFGKAKDGADYLAIYACGEIDGLYAVYRSDDMAKNWVRVNDDQHQYGSINYSITGDLRVYGRVFVATNGRGIVYGEPGSGSVTPTPPTTPTPTPASPTPTPSVSKGDVNMDGKINSTDCSMVKRHILGISTLTKDQFTNADVNSDGKVNSTDYSLLKRYVLGNITSF
ncbi:MAG TPA: dockerin type I domain-containing protein, partial [Clostridia bacterium]